MKKSVNIHFTRKTQQQQLFKDIDRCAKALEISRGMFIKQVLAEHMNRNDMGTYNKKMFDPPKPLSNHEKKISKKLVKIGNKICPINQYTQDVIAAYDNSGYKIKKIYK